MCFKTGIILCSGKPYKLFMIYYNKVWGTSFREKFHLMVTINASALLTTSVVCSIDWSKSSMIAKHNSLTAMPAKKHVNEARRYV